jgi:2-polyprenyl-3-methyl-5-hydroxy-6-metoxy-1,4-benzoquinol methylase
MSGYKSYITTEDFLVTHDKFDLLYDRNMDMLLTHPRPKELSHYYNSDAYISHHDSAKTFIDKIYKLVKSYTLNRKVELIETYSNQEKTLLDIGSGTGEFLQRASKNNWKCYGVEPNKKARKLAISKKLDIEKSLEALGQKKYDIITLWHVLEHLPELDEQITKIESLLKSNGTLIIAVPNYKSYDAKHYGSHWAAYDAPRHLWHFSQQSISKLFENKKLKVIRTKPMLFDSYYVSLLSEKYKTGRPNFIKAFYQGCLSNWKAKSSGEYSSLIYILQRA